MKVRINNEIVGVSGCTVGIDKRFLTRQFVIWSVDKKPSFKIGDEVQIFDDANEEDVLLIKAKIEKIEIDEDLNCNYSGRNDARFIVDCEAEETTQFSEKVTAQQVLEEYAGKFNLKVSGGAKLPSTCQKTIKIGDSIGDEFMRIVQSIGEDLTSDAVGNLEIGKESIKKDDIVFQYGVNVRSREFTQDTTQEFDKYVVVAQGSGFTEEDLIIKGEYGDGEFVRVIRATESLTGDECKKLAEAEYKKDRRRSFLYSVLVGIENKVDINGIYQVIDEDLGIKEDLRVKSLSYAVSVGENAGINIVFER